MKKIVALATLGALLTGILSAQPTDTSASIANTSIRDNDVASSVSEANDSSASVTIAIRMYAVADQ